MATTSFHPMFCGEDFPVYVGGVLSSTTCKYVVQTFLGEGSFGKIAKCLKQDTTEAVAIKILQGGAKIKDAEEEVAMLKKVCDLDPDKGNFVRWHEYFLHKGHPCLVFEVMDINLFDFMEQRRWKPLPLSHIRPITQQLVVALQAFKRIGIMHCDIKPENIMLVDRVQQPLRVKIIDFGLATLTAEAESGSIIQTLWWRAPEILLGLPFSEAIDMWSVGCVMIDLFQGRQLYPADNEYNMIRYIMQTQGVIPRHLLDAGEYTDEFFSKKANFFGFRSWRLKTPLEYRAWSGTYTKEKVDDRILRSLDDLVKLRPWHQEKINDTRMFVDLVKRMLRLDAARRITPCEALQHSFTTMSHLLKRYPHSSYVSTCSMAMDICTRQGQSSGRCEEADTQAEKNSSVAFAEDCTPIESKTETPVTPAKQEVKAPSPSRLPQEAVDVKVPMSLLHETKEIQTPSSQSQEIMPLATQKQVKAMDKVPTDLVQEPANSKPAGPVCSSVKGHLSENPQKKRRKYGFFPKRVNKVGPAGPECSTVNPSTEPEQEREKHGSFSRLVCSIRRGKQRLTQWLEKHSDFHCRLTQNCTI